MQEECEIGVNPTSERALAAICVDEGDPSHIGGYSLIFGSSTVRAGHDGADDVEMR